ncbi:hypothetical protein FACS189413_11280 [Bacteroidia bacterium]|nr:hypothetical protein FACS189413_11280 [Bacteroidia bacterium]
MEIKNIYVSQFENCQTTKTSGSINIWRWLLTEPDCIQIINKIRSTSDKGVIDSLKKKLPAVTMSGIFSQRDAEHLISHTGLISIDIDGKDNPHIQDIEDLKLKLSELPYILYAGLSASGKGVFCVIQIAYPEKHLAHFLALEANFYAMEINIDPSCKDIVRLRFRSWDSKPIINLNATIYEECADTSSIVKLSRNTTRIAKSQSSLAPQSAQEEETALSIEEQFLRPTIDENTVINTRAKNSKEKVSDFVDFIGSKQVDITAIYYDWLIICSIIIMAFGKDGRKLFHEISRFYPNYTTEECDQQYNRCLQKDYTPAVKRLSEIAKKYGISYIFSN